MKVRGTSKDSLIEAAFEKSVKFDVLRAGNLLVKRKFSWLCRWCCICSWVARLKAHGWWYFLIDTFLIISFERAILICHLIKTRAHSSLYIKKNYFLWRTGNNYSKDSNNTRISTLEQGLYRSWLQDFLGSGHVALYQYLEKLSQTFF